MAMAIGEKTIFSETSNVESNLVNLEEKENDVLASREAVLIDRENRAKKLISKLLDVFDTYSPTDYLVYTVGVIKSSYGYYNCYVSFSREKDALRLKADELLKKEVMKFKEEDPLIKKMNELDGELINCTDEIIKVTFDYIKKKPLKHFMVTASPNFELMFTETEAICDEK